MKKTENRKEHLLLEVILLFAITVMAMGAGMINVNAADKKENIKIQAPTNIFATATKNNVNITWKKSIDCKEYYIYQYDDKKKEFIKIGRTKSQKYTVKNLKRGKSYVFKVRGTAVLGGKQYYSKYSKELKVDISKKGYSTIKNYLKIALEPVGRTMYVWGGGWNIADISAGKDGKTIGLNPNWSDFFAKQNSWYNFRYYNYMKGYGLDCSGYVGWTAYNVFQTENNKGYGYVYGSTIVASTYAKKGWGTFKYIYSVKDYKAGDIMSSQCSDCRHTWIVLGQCRDKSVVLMESSPAGVKISGTPKRNGQSSQAIALAKKYMKKYYPAWYKKFPKCSVSTAYLKHYGQFRWDTSGNKIMTDPDKYAKKYADGILKDLFEEA